MSGETLSRRLISSIARHKAWDCSYCETEGLSAYNCKQCHNCGASLGFNKTYKTSNVIDNYSFKGRDVVCASCESRNEKRFTCRNCGDALDNSDDAIVGSFTFRTHAQWKKRITRFFWGKTKIYHPISSIPPYSIATRYR